MLPYVFYLDLNIYGNKKMFIHILLCDKKEMSIYRMGMVFLPS